MVIIPYEYATWRAYSPGQAATRMDLWNEGRVVVTLIFGGGITIQRIYIEEEADEDTG